MSTYTCYYSGAGNGSLCYELYDKSRLAPELELISNSAEEAVNLLGQKIEYYINTYQPASADNLYGEQPTMVYHGPYTMKMIINLNESSLALSKFGFNADDEITGFISIKGYKRIFENTWIYDGLDQSVEPKAGDVFCMSEYGSTRPGGRAGNYFIITERRDQDVSDINPLGGHYVWRIAAKRLEYSFQPGISGESQNDQVYDDTFAGLLSTNITEDPFVAGVPSLYIENISEAQFFDELGNYIADANDGVDGGDANIDSNNGGDF
jgi:hypothetical protein